MTDKELIKQEIERLKHTSNAYDRSRFMLLLEIEEFINSLPKESGCEVNFTTKNENLVEEVDNFLKDQVFGKLINRNAGIALARHFAEWQKKKDQETIELAEDHAMLAGMEKMKEEMMKDALDGCVSLIVKSDKSSLNLFISTPQLYKELQKYKDGDKLKIIIVKED